jgi:hypothetical protein
LTYRHAEAFYPFDGNVVNFAKQAFEPVCSDPKRWYGFEPDNLFGARIPPNKRTFERPGVNA